MKYWRTPLDHDQMKIPRGEVHIIVDRCKGCGFCVEYCPKEILVLSDEFNKKGYHPPKVVEDGECVNCNLCEMICPDFAIYSVPVPDGSGGTQQGSVAETNETVRVPERSNATKGESH